MPRFPTSVLLLVALTAITSIISAATPIADAQLTGTANRLEDGAEFTIGTGSTLTATTGSVVDLFHSTIALPENLSLKNVSLTGLSTTLASDGTLSLLSGSRFLAEAGSFIDLSAAGIIFPSTVVLTTESQTLRNKTLVEPLISSITSADNTPLSLAGSRNGATLSLASGENGAVILMPSGEGRAIVNGVHLYAATTGSYNTFVGYEIGRVRTSAAAYNTGLGHYALAGLTSGYANTAIGVQALFRNTTGTYNLGVGVEALVNNTTGLNNTAVGGYDTLFSNTTGNDNTALGYAAAYRNTTGSSNVAIGTAALYTNASSSGVTAIGVSAGYSNTGALNTFIGALSGAYFDNLGYNSTGDQNTLIGASAGASARTASKNTFIGYNSGKDFVSGSGNIAIGANIALPSTVGDSQINIGDRFLGTAQGALNLIAGGSNQKITLTPTGGAPVSITGVSHLTGMAKTFNRFLDIGSTENNAIVGLNLGVYENDRNARVAFFLDDASGTYGFNATASSGVPQFLIQSAGVTRLTLRNVGDLLITAVTSATQFGDASIATAGGIYADKNIFSNGDISTRGKLTADGGVIGNSSGLALNSSTASQPIVFNLGSQEIARLAPASGNLLLGGTSDIVGTGGMKIFGTTAGTSPTTGAFQVVGGVGIGGALNVGSTGVFGGALRILVDRHNSNELGFYDSSGATHYGTLGIASSRGSLSTNSAVGDLVLNAQGTLRFTAGGTAERLMIDGNDGTVSLTATHDARSTSTGSLVLAGGAAIQKNAFFGADVVIAPMSDSSATTRMSGTVIANISGIWFQDGGTPTRANVALAGNETTTILNAPDSGTVGMRIGNADLFVLTNTKATLSNIPLEVTATTDSTSATTGSATFAGGVGVAGQTSTGRLKIGNGATIDAVLTTVATLDFPSVAANGGVEDMDVTIDGAELGDAVNIVEASGVFVPAGLTLKALVTAPNTVTVRLTNTTASSIMPPVAAYRITVVSF